MINNLTEPFRLDVPPSAINHDSAGYRARSKHQADLLIERAAELKALGYRRIVLAGQSGGAYSVAVAASRTPVDGTILVVPCCGTGDEPYMSLTEYLSILGRSEASRTIVVYFAGEQHVPDDLGRRSEKALASSKTCYLILDQPLGLAHHNAGGSPSFARTYTNRFDSFIRAAAPCSERLEN